MYVGSILSSNQIKILLSVRSSYNNKFKLLTEHVMLTFTEDIIAFNEYKLQDMSTHNHLKVCIFSLSQSMPPFLQLKGLSNPTL